MQFTAKERDQETGLDFFEARYFSSAQGRFTSPDEPFAGQSASNPQTWNLYGYGLNNPLRYVDPSGHEPCENGFNPENGNFCTVTTASSGNWFTRIVGAIGSVFTGFGREAGGNTLIGTANLIDTMRQMTYGGTDLRQPTLQPRNNWEWFGGMYGMAVPFVIGEGEAGLTGRIIGEAAFRARQ